MILTIDVGNTTVSVAIFEGDRIVFRNRLLTPSEITEQYLRSLIKWKLLGPSKCRIIVSSVVPLVDSQLKRVLKGLSGQDAIFIDCRSELDFSIAIDDPEELGADLIAGAAGGFDFFVPPFIVIDSGTAITVCCIDREKRFLGGSIMPGIEMAIRSLSSNTAKLGRIRFEVPGEVIGKNTDESIRSGIFYNCIGGIGRLIDEYREILGKDAKVIATGGLSRFFRNRIDSIDLFEPDLIFYGLKRILERMSG